MARGSVILVATILVAAGPSAGRAEQPNWQKYAVTDIQDVDVDFYFQGEYYGEVPDATMSPQWFRIGLQVVALGNGQFQAVEHLGGLPGSGYAGGLQFHLSGHRQGRAVYLTGDGHNFVLVNGYALVYYRNTWRPVGQINKVERVSPTLGSYPPPGAYVLFDGSSVDSFDGGRMTWDGELREGTQLRYPFEDYRLHIEFKLPYMPYARQQGRSNSGVYLQSRYEVQILDSFGLEGADNECGALYRYRRPDINMCFPPLSWQTYDIEFQSPRFDPDGNKLTDANISVWHNGVLIHAGVSVPAKTGGGAEEGPDLLPIRFQDHGNPVRFRNIWLLDYKRNPYARSTATPVYGTVPSIPQQSLFPVDEQPASHYGTRRYKRAHWLY